MPDGRTDKPIPLYSPLSRMAKINFSCNSRDEFEGKSVPQAGETRDLKTKKWQDPKGPCHSMFRKC